MIGGPGNAANLYVNIYGKKGQGKTTLLRQLYARAVTAGACATFIDSTGRNADLASVEPRAIGATVRSVEGWFAVVRRALQEKRQYNIIVDTSLMPARLLSPLFRIVMQAGNCLLAIDEAEGYLSVKAPDPEALSLVARGRNRQVSIFSTVRFPKELDTTLRGNADLTIAFAMSSAHFAKIIETDAMSGYPGAAKLIMAMRPFHYLQYREGSLSRGIVQIPS